MSCEQDLRKVVKMLITFKAIELREDLQAETESDLGDLKSSHTLFDN